MHRILHISTRLILGGSQENTVLSCEGQTERGHEVHLAFGPIYGPEGSLLERVRAFRAGNAGQITTHEVPDLVREVSPLRDWRCLKQLENLIERIEPDIVHTHSSKAGILGRSAAWRVLKRTKRAMGIVHTIHGPPFMPVEGAPLRRAMIRLTNSVYAAAERRAARRCHMIAAVADAMTRQFLARNIGRAEQFVTVRSGIEVGPYVHVDERSSRAAIRKRLGIERTDFVVGTIARLAEHKGHDDVLDALEHVLRSESNWKLLWVGDGWWRERLAARIKAAGLEHRVILTGLVPPEQIPGLLRAMDVLCHASSREGLPRTVPQALLAGVCPVAYDIDGTGEICREMQTGRLVPHGDVDGLRQAIVWLAEHPLERETLARTGQAECLRTFTTERMIDHLSEVYERALSMA